MSVLARVTYFEKEFGVQNSPELATKVLTNQHFLDQLRRLQADEPKKIGLIDQEIKQIARISDEDMEKKSQAQIVTIPKNYWNFINPFWLLWQLVKKISGWIKKHTLTSAISGAVVLVGLVATDYAMAWKNLKVAWEFIKRLLNL